MCPEGLGLGQRGQTDPPSLLPPAATFEIFQDFLLVTWILSALSRRKIPNGKRGGLASRRGFHENSGSSGGNPRRELGYAISIPSSNDSDKLEKHRDEQ